VSFGVSGQRLEAEIGLYFYNARFYDATLGRFSQADTIIPGAGNPLALDRYAYVQNNSLRYTDPSGHAPIYPPIPPDKRDLTGWFVATAVDIAESKEMKNVTKLNLDNKRIKAGLEFYGLVGDHKKYDVKVKIEEHIGNTVKLGDNWYEYSTPGNILFGFYGLAAGFSKSELHWGAGGAQVLDFITQPFTDKEDVKTGTWSTSYDTEDDYYAIEFGFFLYENYYEDDGILTTDEFLIAFDEFEHADKLALELPPEYFNPSEREYEVDEFYQ